MGLNDEQEKLRQAREWLVNGGRPTQREAAWEYVRWTLTWTPSDVLRAQAQAIADEVLGNISSK